MIQIKWLSDKAAGLRLRVHLCIMGNVKGTIGKILQKAFKGNFLSIINIDL